MNKVMFEVMRYFGLNHRQSSGVKWKLIELRVTFTLESQINTEYEKAQLCYISKTSSNYRQFFKMFVASTVS